MKTPICILLTITLLPLVGLAKDPSQNGRQAALPDATLANVKFGELVNDVPFDKDALAGKVVVVEHWGVRCPPCIASLPHLAKLAKANEAKGLVVVGLERQGSTKEDILKMLKSADVKYPVMMGGSAPGSTGSLPYICVFDTTGKLIFSGRPSDSAFETTVKKALQAVKK